MSLFIRQLITQMILEIYWQWVKGHQDTKMLYNQLSHEAKLNIDADELAELGHSLQSIPHDHLHGTRIRV